MRRVCRSVVLLLALTFASLGYALAHESSPSNQLRDLARHAEAGAAAASANQPALMQAEYEELHALWETLEDEVRAHDPVGYAELEGALMAIDAALKAQPLDPAGIHAAYERFEYEANEVAGRIGEGTASEAIEATPGDLLMILDSAYAAVERGEAAFAAGELKSFMRAWPSAEGAVVARSPEAYEMIEANMGRAAAALEARPADLAAAEAAIERMRAALSSTVTTRTYTALDAASIILREGLEALLVIVALLAFLQRSGNSHRRGWVWAGGALGVLASVIAAVIMQMLFTHVSAGQNREAIEGATGLVAAALLFYVSYWLHSKASLHAWQGYINARTGQALARGSMAGLALLAFLAVFREGAETTIFYLGMAPSIALSDLLLGLGIGLVALAIAAVLILVVGVRLPLRPFFRVAGLLVYYLGFKFVGTGVHALQVAGALPVSPIAGMPALPFFGIYPTWESTLPQLALLLGALAAFLYLRALDRRAPAASTASTAA